MVHRRAGLIAAVVAGLSMSSSAAFAEIAVSANDGKLKLVNGKTEVAKDGVDTLTIIDLAANPPKAIHEIKVPASVVGPPSSVAISPKGDIALVTSAMRIDPGDPTKQVPSDVVTVIDLKQSGAVTTALKKVRDKITGDKAPAKPEVIATLKAGRGAAGLSINKAGTLALVANRSEGTISVFSIAGKTVTPVGEKIVIGNDKSGPSAVSFTPDGKMALVTRDGDNKISVLTIEGTTVKLTGRDISAGMRPYGLDISAKGDVAVVANIGTGSGDSDTVSLIDLKLTPPRVVATVSVGQTPEGIKMSPDGNWVAVVAMHGSNKAANSPFYSATGRVVILRRQGTTLTRTTEAPTGKWCQGAAWSANSRKLLVGCMVEQHIHAFTWNGTQLKEAGLIKTTGGPAGIRTVEK